VDATLTRVYDTFSRCWAEVEEGVSWMADAEVVTLSVALGLMFEVDDQWSEVDDQSEGGNQIRSIPTVS